jgi:hypothetical protein
MTLEGHEISVGDQARRFESVPGPPHMAFKGSRLCRGSDHSWLLMTARIPGKPEYGPKILHFLKFNTWLSYTWLVKIDSAGKVVGAPRKILEPDAHYYDVSDLGGVCLGCCCHDGKIICLNPEGTVVEVPTQDDKSKSEIPCRLINSLDPDKLAAEFCADSLHVAFQALRTDAAGNPEVYLEIERKSGQRLFVRRSFKWDELMRGDYEKRTARIPTYYYLGQVTVGRKLSAVFDQDANELLFVDPAPFKVVKRMAFMEKEHGDDLKKGIKTEKEAKREIEQKLREMHKGELDPWMKELMKTDFSRELPHYGKVSFFEQYWLDLSGLFQMVEIGDKLYGLYVEMHGHKVILRPYEDGKMGKAVPIPNPKRAQTIDYQTAAAGKQLFAFTVEKESVPELASQWAYVQSWFFRTYRFDGIAWKQLPDWCKSVVQKDNGPFGEHDHTEAGDLIPVYQPVVLGDKVFVYYCATRQSTSIPKIERFSPMDAK